MVNRIESVYLRGSNKMVQFEILCGCPSLTPEEGRRAYRPKHCDDSNKDEVNSLNILSNDNYQASSQKFRQILKTI